MVVDLAKINQQSITATFSTHTPEIIIAPTASTYYHQHFPYLGLPRRVVSYLGPRQDTEGEETQAQRLGDRYYDYQLFRLKNNQVFAPSPDSTQTYQFDVSADVQSTQLRSKTNQDWNYTAVGDNHLTLTRKVTSRYNHNQDKLSAVTHIYTYNNEDQPNWRLNRITQQQSTYWRHTANDSGATQRTRSHQFQYDRTNGLLLTGIRAPEGGLQDKRTTRYCYDVYGSQIHTIIYSDHFSDIDCTTRQQTTKDDPQKVFRRTSVVLKSHRWPIRYENARSATLTFRRLNDWGQPLETLNDVGKVTVYGYDSFGKTWAHQANDGSHITVQKRWKNQAWEIGSPLPVSSMTGEYRYVEKHIHQGYPTRFIYRDKRNRKVATAMAHFAANQWRYQLYHYHPQGWLIGQSVPSLTPYIQSWDSQQYDRMGRLTRKTHAKGISTTYHYQGLTIETRTIDSDNTQTRITRAVHNALDEVVAVTDALGHEIKHDYDALGKRTLTVDIDGNAHRTTIDKWGRKIAQNNPDQGAQRYQYNAMDELVSHTDARGHQTRLYRNDTGQIVLRRLSGGILGATTEETRYTWNKAQLQNERFSTGHVQRQFTYDSAGRVSLIRDTLDNNQTYTRQSTYDQYGRPFQQFAPDLNHNNGCLHNNRVAGQCWGVKYSYNAQGYQQGQEEARYSASSTASLKRQYSQITGMDAWGHVTNSLQNDGKLINLMQFNTVSGTPHMTQTTQSAAAGGQRIRSNQWRFNPWGNLIRRQRETLRATATGHRQDLTYDKLNRLLQVNDSALNRGQETVLPDNHTLFGMHDAPVSLLDQTLPLSSSSPLQKVSYSDSGKILKKTIQGQTEHYCYNNNSHPNGVRGISHTADCSGHTRWHYDDAGNLTRGTTADGQTRLISYNHFNKPSRIQSQGDTRFTYDTRRQRFKRVTTETHNNQSITTTTYKVGNVEVIQRSGSDVTETRRYLPGAIRTHRSNGTDTTHYLHKDYLGSLDSITNEQGKIVAKYRFDPWGKKHTIPPAQWWVNALAKATTLATALNITSRGFTGHEHIEHGDIIHMNGRIYDPSLGRFLQADPILQAPHNGQNYNGYSYVLNNPLRYIDPSGYGFWSFFRKGLNGIIRGAIRLVSKVIGRRLTNLIGTAIASYFGGRFGMAYWQYQYTRAFGGTRRQAWRNAIGGYLSGGNESGYSLSSAIGDALHTENFKNGAVSLESSNISKYSSGEAQLYLSESKRLARQYALRVKSFDARVIMDRTKIAGHAVELGYFENLARASKLIRLRSLAQTYQTAIITDLNTIYSDDAMNLMSTLAGENITGISDMQGSLLQILGGIVPEVGIVSSSSTTFNFGWNVFEFSNYLSDSDKLSHRLLQIEVDAGVYYSKNCGGLKC